MRSFIIAGLVLLPGTAVAQTLRPGQWTVTSTVVDIAMPGVPGFLLRMARGRSRNERKCVPPGQGTSALLAPDPKARCSIGSEHVADGRYAQTLSCPQKRGEPLTVSRTGTYDGNGFTGRATMTGRTPKGELAIVLDQRTAYAGVKCVG